VAHQPVHVVRVSAWGSTVGAVVIDERTGYAVFEYDPAWLGRDRQLSPLQMPNGPGLRTFPGLSEHTYRRLPALLADSLPDRFGSSLLEAYLAGEGIDPTRISPLDRLAYLGSRGMGTLEYAPPSGPATGHGTAYEIANLVAEANNAINGSFGTETDATAGIRHIVDIGSSAGGVRAKAVIAYNDETGEIRGGQIDAPPGFAHWILKLDGVTDSALGTSGGEGRLEYAYSLMARAAGIDMMESRLLEEGGRAHFYTRRYDRDGNIKIHTQTLCAMNHLDFREIGTHDYSQYLLTIRALGLGPAAEREAFRRAAFNVAAANRDDHTKNCAFTLTATGSWALAPAYDLVHTPHLAYRMMSVNGSFDVITTADFTAVADRFEIAGAADILGQVADAADSWAEFAQAAGLDDHRARHASSDFVNLRRPRGTRA
jgi:serine/threonine-protein kinase HipA